MIDVPFEPFGRWHAWDDARGDLEARLARSTVRLVDSAFACAERCHGSQRRPGGEPYREHLLQVLEILVIGAGVIEPDTLVAAVLHDVVEDTPCGLDEVRSRFGEDVAAIVAWVTHGAGEIGESRAVSRRRYLERLAHAPPAAILVKLADRLSNVQRLDTHPLPASQVRYYRETIEHVVPLAERYPWFAGQYRRWAAAFAHLAADDGEPRRTPS